jgi:hypothetical protein
MEVGEAVIPLPVIGNLDRQPLVVEDDLVRSKAVPQNSMKMG